MITANLELVTPDMASRYLALNVSNRKLNKKTVRRYKTDIINGRFKITTDCIGFNEDGYLINGQHRLTAIVEANIPARLLVARGLPNDSFPAIDNHKARGLSDVLYIEEEKHNVLKASIVRQKVKLDKNNLIIEGGGDGGSVTNSTLFDEYKSHKEVYDNIAFDAMSLVHKMNIIPGSVIGGYAAYLILTLHYPYEQTLNFFRGVLNIIPPTNGVQVELARLIIRDKTSTMKMTAIKKQVLIIKAWNAYITGKTLKVLSYNEINDKDKWFI